jgi:hypothetical protein
MQETNPPGKHPREAKMDAMLTAAMEMRSILFGDTPLGELLVSWLPLFLCAVLPLLCMPFVALGLCGDAALLGAKPRFGERTVLRKVMLAVRADMRMGIQSKYSRFAKFGLDVEAAYKFNTKSGKQLLEDAANAKQLGDAALEKQKAEHKAAREKGSKTVAGKRSY